MKMCLGCVSFVYVLYSYQSLQLQSPLHPASRPSGPGPRGYMYRRARAATSEARCCTQGPRRCRRCRVYRPPPSPQTKYVYDAKEAAGETVTIGMRKGDQLANGSKNIPCEHNIRHHGTVYAAANMVRARACGKLVLGDKANPQTDDFSSQRGAGTSPTCHRHV